MKEDHATHSHDHDHDHDHHDHHHHEHDHGHGNSKYFFSIQAKDVCSCMPPSFVFLISAMLFCSNSDLYLVFLLLLMCVNDGFLLSVGKD